MNPRCSPFKVAMLMALAAGACFTGFTQGNDRATSDGFSAFRIISDRNIFDPNRRSRVVSGPVSTIVDSFSLTGTLDYAKGKFAVFDGTSSDYHKVLEPGGRIAGYTVAEIGQDNVKLAAGTNTLELKVGTQMRRDDNGHWSAGEPAEYAEHSYVANSSRGDSGRRRFNSESRRSPARANVESPAPAPNPSAPEPTGGPEADAAPGPSSAGGLDPNDPVARMIARRLQETGGNENGNDNTNSNQ